MSAVPEGFSGVQIRSVVEDGGVDSYAPAPHNVNGVHNRSANAVGGLCWYVALGHVDHGEQETEATLFCAWYVAFGQMEHDSLGAVKEYPFGQKSHDVSSQPIVVLP